MNSLKRRRMVLSKLLLIMGGKFEKEPSGYNSYYDKKSNPRMDCFFISLLAFFYPHVLLPLPTFFLVTCSPLCLPFSLSSLLSGYSLRSSLSTSSFLPPLACLLLRASSCLPPLVCSSPCSSLSPSLSSFLLLFSSCSSPLSAPLSRPGRFIIRR